MSHTVKINENKQIPLPDVLCRELGINVGDILICELIENASKIIMKKHVDQTLTDVELACAGNLTRVISCIPDCNLKT